MILIGWILTVALFFVKITRYADMSWFQVLLPMLLGYVLVIACYLIVIAGEHVEERRRHKSLTARGYDTSHIKPLDSIKNPRKS